MNEPLTTESVSDTLDSLSPGPRLMAIVGMAIIAAFKDKTLPEGSLIDILNAALHLHRVCAIRDAMEIIIEKAKPEGAAAAVLTTYYESRDIANEARERLLNLTELLVKPKGSSAGSASTH